MAVLIESRNLTKKYADHLAIKGVDLQIEEKECFGILGPNGSGKSSLMKMMYCNSPITSGELFVMGLNVKTNTSMIKSQIGVVAQENYLDHAFSLIDNLLIHARFYGIPMHQARTRARELIRFMKLEEYNDNLISHIDKSGQRRLMLARALMSQPKILLLDEPSLGLNQRHQQFVWESILNLKNQGKTIVLTTQSMNEAEKLCNRIILIDKGKILCEGNPFALIEKYIGHEIVEFQINDDMEYYIKKIREKFEYQVIQNRLRLFIKPGQEGRSAIQEINSRHILVRKASLEDVFLRLAGYEIRLEAV